MFNIYMHIKSNLQMAYSRLLHRLLKIIIPTTFYFYCEKPKFLYYIGNEDCGCRQSVIVDGVNMPNSSSIYACGSMNISMHGCMHIYAYLL